MKALYLLIAASAIAVTAAYAQGHLPTGFLAAVSNEPVAILLSGSLLIGLGGALRRCDF
jgi:hypothetical protein